MKNLLRDVRSGARDRSRKPAGFDLYDQGDCAVGYNRARG